jgi:purine-binding chemotaxis protein CheW
MSTARATIRSVEPSSAVEALAGKYLTFVLGDGEYGLPVRKVREIIKLAPITAVPHVAPWIKGVVNLRGKVIPIVDLRVKFNLEAREGNDRTCIIVLETMVRESSVLTGIIVDSVSDVMNITADQIEEPPYLGGPRSTCVDGLAKVKGTVKILLNLDQVCRSERDGGVLSPPAA